MKNIEKIRLCVLCSLVFYFMGIGCFSGSETLEDVSIYYEFAKAKRLVIARKLLAEIPEDSIKNHVYVKRAVDGAPRMLGELTISEKVITFEPLIPFTPGLTYELYIGGKKHSDIEIPADEMAPAPAVIEIFPGQDSLPENLLKIYIQFSQPMQEGISADYIVLVKGEKDTLKNVFLDLQPELWDPKRSLLTLWLDPGRIKRDLHPNQQLGAPLVAGGHYTLVIKPGWQNGQGKGTQYSFVKKFFTVGRDSISPDPRMWTVLSPLGVTKDAVEIVLHESLDRQLLQSAVRVLDKTGAEVAGRILVVQDESRWLFMPEKSWPPYEDFTIEIEAKLEDLAGNNLNRLFDTDLMKPQKKDQAEIYKLRFTTR